MMAGHKMSGVVWITIRSAVLSVACFGSRARFLTKRSKRNNVQMTSLGSEIALSAKPT